MNKLSQRLRKTAVKNLRLADKIQNKTNYVCPTCKGTGGVTKLTTLEMLHALQTRKDGKVLYDIHFRNAGVGFTFWKPPSIKAGCELLGSACCQLSTKEQTDKWRQYLIIERYYTSFEQVVKEEYKRMTR
jgi:hypothetical protein